MGGNANEMMSLLDSSLFPSFDMPMNLNIGDAMSQQQQQQRYAPVPAPHSSVAALAPATSVDEDFSPDSLIPVPGMAGAGPLSMGAMGSSASASVTAATPGDNNGDAGVGSNNNIMGISGTLSTLTEFTKRRNWPARVVEELRDLLQILDANGKIRHVSPSIERLTGYKGPEILNKFVQELLHPDDVGVFNAEFNDAIASGIPLRMFHRLKKKDGSYAVFETVGHAHIAAAKFAPNPNNQTPFCQAVFMMSRPYPVKNARLLDTFLEHKMENERLKRRIAELKREEAEDAEESQRTWRQSQEAYSDMTPSDGTARGGGTTPFYGHVGGNIATSPDVSMPPPERPGPPTNTGPARDQFEGIALTRENLEGIAGSQPDSIREKMARYDGGTTGVTTNEAVEMLTGLRYGEGERSGGFAMGNTSPRLMKGDAGIAMPMERDPRTGENKKKKKKGEEYVCTDCGRLPLATLALRSLAHRLL